MDKKDALRARHLHEVHHARRSSGRAGTCRRRCASRSTSRKGRVIVRGKLVDAGRAEVRRLRPLLQAEHPASRSSRPRTTTTRVGDGHAAGARATPRCSTCPFVFSSNGDGFLFHDRTGHVEPGRARARRSTSSRRPTSSGRATARGRASRRRGRGARHAGLLLRRQRQGASLLPGQRHQPRRRGRRHAARTASCS